MGETLRPVTLRALETFVKNCLKRNKKKPEDGHPKNKASDRKRKMEQQQEMLDKKAKIAAIELEIINRKLGIKGKKGNKPKETTGPANLSDASSSSSDSSSSDTGSDSSDSSD